ncbi:MAG: stage II sporulation protein P, partial [Oscillospiraceae bacterium]
MAVFKKIIMAIICLALVFLSINIVKSQAFYEVSEKIACFSAMINMPDAMSQMLSPSEISEHEVIDNISTVAPPQEESEASLEEPVESETAPVVNETANIEGKIISQVLSAYRANTIFNNIYVNNKCSYPLDIKNELSQPFNMRFSNKDEPQVLIYHTHATESYMMEARDFYTSDDRTRTTDTNYNMVKIGDKVAQKLSDAGIGVIHDKTLHDYPAFTGSYSRSAKTIEKHLKENPGIKIIIDLHRDSISSGKTDKVAPVVEINGKNAVQVMLVTGSETGGVEGYPNWKENLRLSLRLQQTMEVMYPGLARAMQFDSTKYNQHLSSGAMLIEMGTEANSLEQAEYSAEL